MRRDLRSCAVNDPVGHGDYTRGMMIKHLLTLCAAATAAAAGSSFAHAQQGYPIQQAPVYSAPYPPQAGYPAEYRPGDRAPDFDAADDDEMAPPQQSAGLPPP